MFRISARTVLELGAELISKDSIAFYELIKNGFDAQSKTGVEIRFSIVLRRNAYLALRSAVTSSEETNELDSVEALRRKLDDIIEPTADRERVSQLRARCAKAKTRAAFVAELDEAYRQLNTIEISDTGTGMSADQLAKSFLVIGTPSRKREVEMALQAGAELSPYLGEKGIGRLSAMRLGEYLTVTTASSHDEVVNVLKLDWRRFNDIELMIEDVKVAPERGGPKPSPDWSGTILEISDLSTDWTGAKVKVLAEYDFARLTDPFVDPKSRRRIALFWNGARIEIPWMDTFLLGNAHAAFKGTYTVDEGKPVLRCKLEARDLKAFKHPPESETIELAGFDLESLLVGTDRDLPSAALTSIGPFDFEVYWYNRKYLTALDGVGDQKAVRDLQKRWAGILLFRDTFRIFPYGDDEDDWLGLDRHAMGRSGYTLNKNQFVGRVRISRTRNPQLVDQTNREGLRRNPEERLLVGILSYLIQDSLLGFMREMERRYGREPIDLADAKSQVAQLEKRAKAAIARMRTVVPRTERDAVDAIEEAFREFRDLVEAAQARIAEVEKDGKQMLQMAGIGLMVEIVAHELARTSENTLKVLDGLQGKQVPVDVRGRLDTLRAEMKTVSKRLRILDPLSVAGRQRAETFDLAELIEEVRDGHHGELLRHKITFKIEGDRVPVKVRTVKGMVAQILENLISNSVYWIKVRAEREANYVPSITVRVERNPITVSFTDNGPGIAPENAEKVFRLFWSLKDNAKRRGLGLYIARDNATHIGATLTIAPLPDKDTGRLQTFVLEFPAEAAK